MATSTRPRTRPGPLAAELATSTDTLERCQYRLVLTAARFADSHEWVAAVAPTTTHCLARLADVEACTARERIRVGRRVRELPATVDAFAARRRSYAKVRALSRFATPENDGELIGDGRTCAGRPGDPRAGRLVPQQGFARGPRRLPTYAPVGDMAYRRRRARTALCSVSRPSAPATRRRVIVVPFSFSPSHASWSH